VSVHSESFAQTSADVVVTEDASHATTKTNAPSFASRMDQAAL